MLKNIYFLNINQNSCSLILESESDKKKKTERVVTNALAYLEILIPNL